MLHEAEREGRLRGIKVCRDAPSVSHLLFADDSLLLMEANEVNAREVQNILDAYERCSGQTINKEKSSILFSKNTGKEQREEVKSTLNINAEGHSGRYMGLPVYIGKSKSKTFAYIRERIWKKIQGGNEKLLSKAGKEVLIKAVAQAIPVYVMSCFDLTKTLCDDLSTMICQYWWSQVDKKNKIHWVNWERLSLPKSVGGLGLRNLHSFNLAMLARQAWRLLQFPNSLCARVLSAKYFPDGQLLRAKSRNGISYAWRSILKGIKMLNKGVIWRVGDGRQINIWKDPWIPRGASRRVSSVRGRNHLITKVEELINPATNSWDEGLLNQTLNQDDVNEILKIPIHENQEDFPCMAL